ncbi:MAG: hypothetical protein QOJ73_5396 [Streptosporangiaceae bacterium]|jgi:hypothetical protein|nr:hypothetical protein [Streptosporangiaceae bacterium]
MRTPNDITAAKGLRGWWPTPPRHGIQRLINPWAAYRHPGAFGVTHIAGGSAAAAVCLRIEALP